MSSYKRKIIFILFFISNLISICWAGFFYPFSEYKLGLILYKNGKFKEAGFFWTKKAQEFLQGSSNPDSFKKAALAEVLATISFEKARDATAYTTWSSAIKHFLEGQTTWKEERKKIKQILDRIRSEIKVATVGGELITLTDDEIAGLDLEDSLIFTDYKGPKPGLQFKSPSEKREKRIETRISYFPRPLNMLKEKSTPLSAYSSKQIRVTTSPSIFTFHSIAQKPEATIPQTVSETPLTEEQVEAAITAWQYFINNYHASTGLVNATNSCIYSTIWDIGSTIAGFVAAQKIGIIGMDEFREKITTLLRTLSSIDLYNNELPNRVYNTTNGKMVDLKMRLSYKGSGWSAIDIGRLLIWLRITENWYQELRDLVHKVVNRWKFNRVCFNEELHGTMFKQKESFYQEGRLGYEQYAAYGFKLWGKDVSKSLDFQEITWIDIYGVKIPIDKRGKAFLTSEPFILAKMELKGLDKRFEQIIEKIYEVQKRRWQYTGKLTAVSEDCINESPWFIYNCIFYDNKKWICVDHSGREVNRFRNISTKAAFAWYAIFLDEYSKKLYSSVITLKNKKYGFYSGIFEDGRINMSYNINTNAIILETILYLKRNRVPFISILQN